MVDNSDILARPPRIQPELPIEEIEIPGPPDESQNEQAFIELFLPLIMVLGYVLLAFSGRGRSVIFIIPMSLAMFFSVIFGVRRFLQARRDAEEQKKAYTQKLSDWRHEMEGYHRQQSDFYYYNYPNPEVLLQIVTQHTRSRIGPRVWERRTSDHDFSVIRLGIGTIPSTVVYKLSGDSDTSSELRDDAQRLCEDSLYLFDVPVTINLHVSPTSNGDDDEDEDAPEASDSSKPSVRHSLGIFADIESYVNLGARDFSDETNLNRGRETVYQYAYALLTHFVAFHSYTDTEVYVIGAQDSQHRWDWMKKLPHVNRRDQANRMAFETPLNDQPSTSSLGHAQEDNQLLALLKRIRSTLLTRQQRANESKGIDVTLPLILVVVDLMNLPTPDAQSETQTSILAEIETQPTIALIMERGLDLGAAVLFLVEHPEQIPSDCQAVIELQQIEPPTDRDELGTVAFRYAETDLNTQRYVGIADGLSRLSADNISSALTNYEIRLSAAASLATSVDLLQIHAVSTIKELEIAEKWQATRFKGEWPQVAIGLQAGNELRTITFDAKESGVHGMIAGTTGSGKTELLRAMIVGLAVKYDPTAVNFLLVDFKGGAGFSDFDKLPHCIESVSNLGISAVERVFASIRAELNRRSGIIAKPPNSDHSAKIDHIVQYRNHFLKTPKDVQENPFPHLFIIIDEFAEMIQDNSEFKAELDSITRLGRALGVSLVLASQHPGNIITDQMGANIKFRICMRVESPEASREVIRTSDAAYLPVGVPGRGYFRVGNEVPELIQVAYASKPYIDEEQASKRRIIWQDDLDENPNAQQFELEEIPMYRVLVDTMEKLAASKDEITVLSKPWPDPVPMYLPLDAPQDPTFLWKSEPGSGTDQPANESYLKKNTNEQGECSLNIYLRCWQDEEKKANWEHNIWGNSALCLRAAVGIIDNPARARQHLLLVDLPEDRHIAIFGASGWGKTMFLQSVMVSLAAHHSPRDLHMYILDFGGRRLSRFLNLPHVGAHISVDEADRVERLLIILTNFLEERKNTILVHSSYDTLTAYNQKCNNPEQRIPAIVVLLDNFVEFRENFEELIPRLISLLREGPGLGIHFVATTGSATDMPSKVSDLFARKLALNLADPTEYSIIVGRGAPTLPEIAGRGVIQVRQEWSRRPLEFQIAQPVGLPQGEKDGILNQLSETSQQNSITFQDKCLALLEAQIVGLLDNLFKRMQTACDELELADRDKANPVEIPDRINLLDLLGVTDIDDIQVLDNWKKSRMNPAWPTVEIGEGAQGKSQITFDAKASGVHGIIAGTTGSGKSELLLTIVTGLAIRYDPSAVNFLLVDYKGGTAFDKFRDLPHCIEVVTNLDSRAVERVFASIKAELDRRSQIIADYNKFSVDHIVDYNRRRVDKKLPDSDNIAPLPHLFIIIDEFAEMIQDYPEYKAQLESITRLGRALGVSLILAAQSPQGKITDQMRSNMKFRVCLRVEGVEDSREMLRRPDAAHLPGDKPGRAYYQVGTQYFDLIQVAQAGSDYKPRSDEMCKFIAKLNRLAAKDDGEISDVELDALDLKLSSVIVDWLSDQAQKDPDVHPQTKGWPDPLPIYLPLTERISIRYLQPDEQEFLAHLRPGLAQTAELALNEALRAWEDGQGTWQDNQDNIWKKDHVLSGVIGLIDNPQRARQHIARINLRDGHAAIFGLGGWGKTTYLRTLIFSLAATHTPRDLHIYILDFGRRALGIFEWKPDETTLPKGLPHVGAVIMSEQEERINRLFRYLEKQLAMRKDYLRGREIVSYNASHDAPDDRLPAILLVINNYDEIKENMEHLEERLMPILRDGRTLGLHVAVTAARPNSMRSSVFNLFTNRLTLRLNDPMEYMDIVGRNRLEIGEIMGRGLIRIQDRKISREALELQIASPVRFREDEYEAIRSAANLEAHDVTGLDERVVDRMSSFMPDLLNELLTKFGQGYENKLTQYPKEALPRPIKKLDQYVTYDRFAEGSTVALGIGDEELDPWVPDLQAIPHFIVAGQSQSGKTNLLQTWIYALATRYDPTQVAMVLIDFRQTLPDYGSARFDFSQLPHVVEVIDSSPQVDELVKKLEMQFESDEATAYEDTREWFIFIDNYSDIRFPTNLSDHTSFENPAMNALIKLTQNPKRKQLHLIMARNIEASGRGFSEDWYMRIWQQFRFGLALQTERAFNFLDVRLPQGMRWDDELPLGRGYVVRPRTKPLLVQTATLLSQGSDKLSDELDEPIERLLVRYQVLDPLKVTSIDGGVKLFDDFDRPILDAGPDAFDDDGVLSMPIAERDISIDLLRLEDGNWVAANDVVKARLEYQRDDKQFKLKLTNISHEKGAHPLVFNGGWLFIHMGDITAQLAQVNDAIWQAWLPAAYQDESISFVSQLLDRAASKKLTPRMGETEVVSFAASPGERLSLVLMIDGSNQWLYDLQPPVEESPGTGPFEVSPDDGYIARSRAFKPNRKRPLFLMLLDHDDTLNVLPLEIVQQIEFDFTPHDTIKTIEALCQLPTAEIQHVIDSDLVLLPENYDVSLMDKIASAKSVGLLKRGDTLKIVPRDLVDQLEIDLKDAVASLDELLELPADAIQRLINEGTIEIATPPESLQKEILKQRKIYRQFNAEALAMLSKEILDRAFELNANYETSRYSPAELYELIRSGELEPKLDILLFADIRRELYQLREH